MVKRIKRILPLPEGAEPARWNQISLQSMERELAYHRFLACPFYKQCLDYAAALHWEGWSCKWCEHWKEKRL